jgi:hypothetical protein
VRIIYAMAHAPEKSLGILVRAENGFWQTSVGGFRDKTPPMKDEQIYEWAQKVYTSVPAIWASVLPTCVVPSWQAAP